VARWLFSVSDDVTRPRRVTETNFVQPFRTGPARGCGLVGAVASSPVLQRRRAVLLRFFTSGGSNGCNTSCESILSGRPTTFAGAVPCTCSALCTVPLVRSQSIFFAGASYVAVPGLSTARKSLMRATLRIGHFRYSVASLLGRGYAHLFDCRAWIWCGHRQVYARAGLSEISAAYLMPGAHR
jgi:hypothetical protein